MHRIVRVIAAGAGDGPTPVDSVILDPALRRTPRGVVTGVGGAQYELALGENVTLRMGDLLVRDDGAFVEVVAEAEPLIEARAKNLTALARLAWHLGDRHVPVQLFANRLRVRRDHEIEALLARLGAKVVAIEAPFDPEGGAYAPAHEHHHHGHGHDHGHNHDHHDHDHHDHDHHGHDHRDHDR
jgi:urease accessory protein